MELDQVPVEWDLIYPVYPTDPIGRVRRERDGFRAWLRNEDLGVFVSGDAAAAAVWERYLEQIRSEHDIASRTHGGYERHAPSTK